jgi:alpha-D-ribose 1-methylphosphonate 5-triphosphate synthase subunit PhnI
MRHWHSVEEIRKLLGPDRPQYLYIGLSTKDLEEKDNEDNEDLLDDQYDEVDEYLADSQYLVALINGDLGWLMYLRYNGDVGFSTRNPDYAGPEDAVLEYYLSNRQRDAYPLSWAIPVSEIERALEYFITELKPPPWLHWHNGSEDGEVIGIQV